MNEQIFVQTAAASNAVKASKYLADKIEAVTSPMIVHSVVITNMKIQKEHDGYWYGYADVVGKLS